MVSVTAQVISKIFRIFTPFFLGKWSNLTVAYFSNGLVQPPSRKRLTWKTKTQHGSVFWREVCLFGWLLFLLLFVISDSYIYIYCNIVVWFSFNLGACFSEMLKILFGDNMPWDAVPPSNSDTWRLWSCDPLTKHAIPCPETNSMSLKNGWLEVGILL